MFKKTEKPKDFNAFEMVNELSCRDALMLQLEVNKRISKESSFTKFLANRGMNFERCLMSDQQSVDEMIFSDLIKREYESGGFTKVIESKLGVDALKGALTLFQWLTTNIGKSVLNEALELTGKKIVSLDQVESVKSVDVISYCNLVEIAGVGEISEVGVYAFGLGPKIERFKFEHPIAITKDQKLAVSFNLDGSCSTNIMANGGNKDEA